MKFFFCTYEEFESFNEDDYNTVTVRPCDVYFTWNEWHCESQKFFQYFKNFSNLIN